ncbi:MrcB family domain-containing protein [Sinorhizobium meliloti]|uniref:MrcB family domain-containing protein n=1 Tax=Rhizobium meliloti TaxID=382 RepID=UPI000FDC2C9C|nr:DUF3578 domain-containing protein [Sinorhizobium meliloti]RVH25069.1 DUF3578 domain-containing protein [Sinorhizobium meliloti]
MPSEVINDLATSDDPIDRELAKTLLNWQDNKAASGRSRSLGYEPKQIRKVGAVEVIRSRILSSAAGFDEVDPEVSYEAIVLRHPERFTDEVVEAARRRLQKVTSGTPRFSSEDLRHIASSRAKRNYGDLSPAENAAYVRVSAALEALGSILRSRLKHPHRFEVRTTSGFNIKSGVRSYIPKDLWFSVSPIDNAKTLAGMPQLFMIVSERGVEYGYGASVSPTDFSQSTVKEMVRKAAPVVFDRLPAPRSTEAVEIGKTIQASGGWYFRRKHRLPPKQKDFSELTEWLSYLRSPEGKMNAAGTISRYLEVEEVDGADFEKVVNEMALVFQPLIDRDWNVASSTTDNDGEKMSEGASPAEPHSGRSFEFAERLSNFLNVFAEKRTGPFRVDEELGRAMASLQGWLEKIPEVASRPTINIRISPGQGGWTKTPWIALLDTRETTTTQRGTYAVFLVAEDLSVTYLTLNQGMTELRDRLGQRGAAQEMVRVADVTRPLVIDLADAHFKLDNLIDLRSVTGAAKNYEIGTIAHVALDTKELPDDATIRQYLERLLEAYDRVITARVGSVNQSQEGPRHEHAPLLLQPYGIDEAHAELFHERADLERYLEIWRHKKNLVLQGAPGVGKSFIARRLAYALIGFRDDRKVQTVQFHQSYSYEDFVQGYRPNGGQGFERKNGTFYDFRNRAMADKDGTYVFIIDEINRGNLAKIFGELMLLIEPDKRDPTWKTRLAYAAADEPDFYLPNNLYIIGMMNTADRSLSVVDYALRRRFAFVSMEPLFRSARFQAHLRANNVPDEVINRIVTGMGELNQAIENDRANLGRGFRIGHSFFTPAEPVADPEAWYRRVVETEIHPLLEEYWFDMPEAADQWRDRLLG